jgi:hypothetical protein
MLVRLTSDVTRLSDNHNGTVFLSSRYILGEQKQPRQYDLYHFHIHRAR